jgi:S-adenosylmethionine:tRNA ribosyltransferase-isomerase
MTGVWYDSQVKVSDFTYDLPDELIALHPPTERGTTRLLVLNKANGAIEHKRYSNFADYIKPGDLVILNDTKVIKARLVATNNKGQTRELLLLEDHHNTDFTQRKVLYRGKIHAGEVLKVKDTDVIVDEVFDGGIAKVSAHTNLLDLAEKAGSVPLPPYMHRDATVEDTERYQTVFAREPGSVAAPTASLNFTKELQEKIQANGGGIAYLTLHVGLGTFLPIRSDDIEGHKMHSEYFEIPTETVAAIRKTKANGNRVFAIGTTVARTLEYAASCHPELVSGSTPQEQLSGEADIFIYPGYEFKLIDGLLTNFHAPSSTVLMLAAAFAGWENLEHAYQEAINEHYAFLSYGDSMLII